MIPSVRGEIGLYETLVFSLTICELKPKYKFIAFDYSIVIEYFFDMNSMIVHVDMYVFPCMMAW